MSLQAAIEAACGGEEVRPSLLEGAFGEIMDGKASEVQIAALLVALRTKGETVGEITILSNLSVQLVSCEAQCTYRALGNYGRTVSRLDQHCELAKQ